MTARKTNNSDDRSDYFSLASHHPKQIALLFTMIAVISASLFYAFLPIAEVSFSDYLLGEVISDGTEVKYLIDQKSETRTTDYLTYWAIDVYKGTTSEARYWVNPLLSLGIPFLSLGIVISLCISALMPLNLGIVRQKIERIIAGFLDEITLKAYGFHGAKERKLIAQRILKADLRDLHDFESEWEVTLQDLLAMHKGLKWTNGSASYRLLHFMDGFRIYMRFYLTKDYSNIILGLVYVGAAVLIIIIGLRGLKFIPATEPSLVFFSLGLEFSLLMVFAVTIMFSKEDDDPVPISSENLHHGKGGGSATQFGSQKEAENLLNMFIKKQK